MQPHDTTSRPPRPRHPRPTGRTRRVGALAALGALALTAVVAACADAPSAPAARTGAPEATARPAFATIAAGPTAVTALLRDVPLASTLTKSFVVRRAGGTIDWREVGLKVHVPANAFTSSTMTITVTALKGDVVAYDFGPDGSVFARPLTIVQSSRGTNLHKAASLADVQGAYFKSAAQVDDAANAASVDAFEPTEIDVTNAQVRFKVTHFSGYMVSMGRKSDTTSTTTTRK